LRKLFSIACRNYSLLLFLIFPTNLIRAQNVDSLLQIVAKEKSPTLQFQLWAEIAYLYSEKNNVAGQSVASQKLLTAAFATRNDTVMIVAYSFLGSHSEDKADFDHALEYYFKALKTAEAIDYKVGICQIAEQIAVVYKQLKNTKETLRFLEKAKEFIDLPEVQNSFLPRGIYANMAEIYLFGNQLDSALIYVQKANEVTKKENDAFGYSRVLLDFGQIYSALGENDLAETYFKKGIAYSDTAKQAINLVSTLYEYSRFLLKNNHPYLSKTFALKSMEEHNKFRNKAGTLSIEISSVLSEIYSNLKRYDSAYFYAHLNNAYRDSVFNEQRLNLIEEMTFAQKVDEAEEQKKKEEEKIKAQHSLQYISIGIGLITFLIIFFLMSNSIIFNSRLISFFSVVGLLLVFEFINLLLHPWLEEITHHSPILMFLILVLIAALLVPLHHKLEKGVTKRMTEKNNRIRLVAAKKTIEKLEPKDKNRLGK